MEKTKYTLVHLAENADARQIPVCLCDNELFFVNRKDLEKSRPCINVIRPVYKSDLEYMRTDEYNREKCKEWWQDAVRNGNYEGSLDEYLDITMDDYDLENDDEMFIYKDDSLIDDLFTANPQLREIIDERIYEDTGKAVGTWEDAGCYKPYSADVQIVFNQELYEMAIAP